MENEMRNDDDGTTEVVLCVCGWRFLMIFVFFYAWVCFVFLVPEKKERKKGRKEGTRK